MKRKMHYTLMVILLAGCSSAYQKGEPLVAADEMKAGPGIFSGEKGGFYLVGGETKNNTPPVSEMNRSDTLRAIDNRIKQLDRDKMELEQLKEAIDKKLKY